MGFFKVICDTIKLLFRMCCDPFMRMGRCCKKDKSIKGEIILVTGAGQGLGRQIALRLAKLDSILVLWDINQENNENAATELRSAGHTVYCYRVDLSDEQDVVQVANRVKEEVGDVTMVINNAGVFFGKSFMDLPVPSVKKSFEVNAMAHFWVLKQFLPHMLELDQGHIVAIVSTAGFQGMPNMTDYCASKHAAAGFMESLAMELQALKKKNIRLTVINPLFITTGLIPNLRTRYNFFLPLLTVEETADVIVNSILKEDEEVFIPPRSRHLIDFMKYFSRSTRYKILEYMNYGYDPIGSEKTESCKTIAEIV